MFKIQKSSNIVLFFVVIVLILGSSALLGKLFKIQTNKENSNNIGQNVLSSENEANPNTFKDPGQEVNEEYVLSSENEANPNTFKDPVQTYLYMLYKLNNGDTTAYFARVYFSDYFKQEILSKEFNITLEKFKESVVQKFLSRYANDKISKINIYEKKFISNDHIEFFYKAKTDISPSSNRNDWLTKINGEWYLDPELNFKELKGLNPTAVQLFKNNLNN
jgi:hypothetical protein